MQANTIQSELDDVMATQHAFTYILEGFMGLGLIVGVCALGVISARAVVERRQEIGVLRSLGFQQGMVQVAFLLESSFISLLGIVTRHHARADRLVQRRARLPRTRPAGSR